MIWHLNMAHIIWVLHFEIEKKTILPIGRGIGRGIVVEGVVAAAFVVGIEIVVT